MKALIAWFVKNPIAANVIMAIMLCGGILGYKGLEREFIPQTTFNGVTISMTWPGASPRDIAEQLVSRAEESVDGLDGIDYIESTASEGVATITVRTKLGADYTKVVDEIKSRVDGIQNLPPDAFRP
ncbi:MAG: efflux RND transporter permease subunit, partial [Litorimonas sp.]